MDALSTSYDPRDRVWSGPKRVNMYTDETSIGKVIFNNMRNWPKNVCQINDTDGVTVTFDHAITWAIRIAQIFKKKGFTYPDIIGVAARNSTYVMPLGVACLLNGTPFHAINPVMDEGWYLSHDQRLFSHKLFYFLPLVAMAHVFTITKPRIIFCDGQEYEKVRSATKGWETEIYTVTDPVYGVPHIECLLNPTPTELIYQPEPLKEGGDQTVAILCSSGTTGLPKAVCISNNYLIGDTMIATNEMSIFTPSCLDWLTGLVTFMFNTLSGCTRIISNKLFSPEHFLEMVKKYKINIAVLPPRYLSALVTCPSATPEALASIMNVHFTGGWVSNATLQKVQNLCQGALLTCGYGMTEMGIVTANAGLPHMSSVGRPVPGARMRIVDENGKNLTYNQVGELYVHTNRVWNGYYGNPEETRSLQDFEGWYHTGDLGYFDEQNFLYIVDRKKEMLRYESLSYFPTEIESIISKMPQVQDVCVVGIYNERIGDEAGALVVRIPGSQLSAQDIIDYVAKHLPAKEKQLHAGVQFIEKLPSNANGKTLRKAARDVFVAKKGACNGDT
ncbi:hypothetical protein KR032_008993 [Drosophila birchii]|nr:hypothetical protein KR032_008993 [Drosophila birchii]